VSIKSKQKINYINWRYYVLVLVVVGIFVGLIGRSAYIQVIEPDRLLKEGDLRSVRTKKSEAHRGNILDRNGELLAVSVPVRAIWADPKRIADANSLTKERSWQALADVLNINITQLLSRVSNPAKRFVYIKRQVYPAVANYVEQLKLAGVYLKPESRRFYPSGEVSAHLVGFTNIDDIGLEGVERSFNEHLTGADSERKIRKDRKGNVIEELGLIEAGKQAKDLVLSLDERIQAISYSSLKKAVALYQATSGSIVVIDVETGEVLAMANSPSYNPNNRGQMQSHRYRNRAITDSFEPGSTVKPLVVASALSAGVVKYDDLIDTSPGWYRLGGKRVSDSHNNGEISLGKILQKSSNVGVSKLALRMKNQDLLNYFYGFGFGNDTGLGLVGEASGIVPQRRRWSDFERATLSFGYGMTATTLQLAHAYSVLGSGGLNRPISILKLDQPMVADPVISSEVARQVLEMLESVTLEGGTGKKAYVPGYRVAGKTGTSRKATAGGYGDDYVALFTGVAPISHPKLAIAVVINEPKGDRYYGGDVAAPVFSEVMAAALRLLNVVPDAPRGENG